MLSFVWRNKKLENIHLSNLKKKTKAEANSKWEEGRRKTELKSAGLPQNQSQHHKKQRGHSLTIWRHILQLRLAEKYSAHLFHTFPSCNYRELERRGAVPTWTEWMSTWLEADGLRHQHLTSILKNTNGSATQKHNLKAD